MVDDQDVRKEEELAAKRAAKEAGIPWEDIEEYRVSVFVAKDTLRKLALDVTGTAMAIKLGLMPLTLVVGIGVQVSRQIVGKELGEGGVVFSSLEGGPKESPDEETKDFLEQLGEDFWEDEPTKESESKVIEGPWKVPKDEGTKYIDF